MSEPDQPPEPPAAAQPHDPAAQAVPAVQAAPPWGAYAAPAAGSQPAAQAAAGDPLRAVLAGFVAAVVGAIAWGLLVAAIHYELGIVAVLVGTGVGWSMQRFGGVTSRGLAITAAVLAAFGIYLGFVLASLFLGAHQLGIGVFDALDLVSSAIGWGTFLTHAVGGVGWLFLAVGAYGAFRIVIQPRLR